MRRKKFFLLVLFTGSIGLVSVLFFASQHERPVENGRELPAAEKQAEYLTQTQQTTVTAAPFRTSSAQKKEWRSYTIVDAITDTLRNAQTSPTNNELPTFSSGMPVPPPAPASNPRLTIMDITRADPQFSIFWPSYYLVYLENMKGAAVQLGAEEQVRGLVFDSSRVVYLFLVSFLDLLHRNGIVNPDSYEHLQYGLIQSFPEGQNSELEALYKQTRARRQQHIFSIAQAQGTVPGAGDIAVSDGGDCYQDPNPGDTSLGINLWAPCCDCTLCDGGGVQPPDGGQPPPPDPSPPPGGQQPPGGRCSGQTNRQLFCGCSNNADCSSGNCVQGTCLAACTSPDCLEIPPANPPAACSPEDPQCLEIPSVSLRETILKYISRIAGIMFSAQAPEEVQAQACTPIGCLNAVCLNSNAIWDPETGICGCDA